MYSTTLLCLQVYSVSFYPSRVESIDLTVTEVLRRRIAVPERRLSGLRLRVRSSCVFGLSCQVQTPRRVELESSKGLPAQFYRSSGHSGSGRLVTKKKLAMYYIRLDEKKIVFSTQLHEEQTADALKRLDYTEKLLAMDSD
ncbi:unnamed protein product [Calypogeia fissa]